MSNKEQIIKLFMSNIKGKRAQLAANTKHCGAEGHWLEEMMGIASNSRNEPDILGYEMKKSSKKITFGDFSASEYLFSKRRSELNAVNGWAIGDNTVGRSEYIRYFGTTNPAKGGRYSWSGSCVPTYDTWNDAGQRMVFSSEGDLCIYYSFEYDKRGDKSLLPDFLKIDDIILIALWKESKLRGHIERKFNQNGFFICRKNIEGVYDKICFGRPFDYEYFASKIREKKIIFDSGMYEGNSRNYSQFRSNCADFWDELIEEEY